MITHYDLFAGIGGFSLALDEVFYDEEIKHIFCEWESFPTAVLKKHWPEGIYYGDIAELVADLVTHTNDKRLEGGERSSLQGRGTGLARNFTIVTGGFPCQPFSHAGRRKGTADDRYQWPNMFEVIRNVKPDWVVAENVRGLVTWNDGLVLETICTDLESEGYEVQPFIIPAVAVGAPHRRDRVWIVANRTNVRRKGRSEAERWQGEDKPSNGAKVWLEPSRQNTWPNWSRSWQEVAFATCHDGVDDGLPRWMDGVTISAARHRKERLKAMGNAIVPQVVMEIFAAIKNVDYGDQDD